jgi:hypothetical protein
MYLTASGAFNIFSFSFVEIKKKHLASQEKNAIRESCNTGNFKKKEKI